MPRQNVYLSNFSAGEVSPLIRGRIDTAKYANGAELVENLNLWPQGPLVRRGGTKYIDIADPQGNSKLYPFVFSDNTAYLLRFDINGLLIYKNDVPLFSGTLLVAVNGVANNGGRFRIQTAAPHGFGVGSGGFWVKLSGIGGTPNANGVWLVHLVDDATHFTLANSVFAGAYTAGGSVFVPLVVTLPSWDNTALCFAQAGDVLYISSRTFPPYKLYRLSETDWRVVQVTFADGPYLDVNDLAPNVDSAAPANGTKRPDVYLEISAYSHTATITSATAFAAGAPSTDSNKFLEYRERDQWKLAQMQAGLAGGATTGTITIIDNIKQFLDISDKLVLSLRGQIGKILGADANGNAVYASSGDANNTRAYYGGKNAPPIDHANEIKATVSVFAAGAVSSQFSNAFGVSDVGRYVRAQEPASQTAGTFVSVGWHQIVSVIDGSGGRKVNVAASPLWVSNSTAGSAAGIGTGTGNYIITNETRTCTVKSFKASVAYDIFNTNDVGRHIRLGFAGRWTWGKITAVTSAHEVSVTLYSDMPRDPQDARYVAGNRNPANTTTGYSYEWRLGAWATVGTDAILGPGFPAVCAFHEQRLLFARTDAQVQTLWGSVSADFENFLPTELDSTVLSDNSIVYTLASGKINPIKWLQSGPFLVIGTTGGEWVAKSGINSSEPLSPTNVSVYQATAIGSLDKIQPVRVASSVLFVNRAGTKLHDIAYSFQEDTLVAKDLTVVSEHIFRDGGGAVRTAWQHEPHGYYWVVIADGTLRCMTREKDQEVVAWSRHSLGGATGVEDVCCVPTTTGETDAVYFISHRPNDGVGNDPDYRVIEKLEYDQFPSASAQLPDCRYLDCATYVAGSVSVVQGLWHLIGKSVYAFADGALIGPFTVSSTGTVTLGATYSKVLVGFQFTSRYKSLPPEGGSGSGVSQGRRKRISEACVRTYLTPSFYHGWKDTNQDLQPIDLTAKDPLTKFFTGTVDLRPNNPFDDESQFFMEQRDALPFNVLSITLVLETNQ